MDQRNLRDVVPELAAELRTLLFEIGEPSLAAQVDELVIVERCRCGDDFCSSFYTAPRPRGPYGAGHYTVALSPHTGMLQLDILDNQIISVEVLFRDDLKAKIHTAMP